MNPAGLRPIPQVPRRLAWRKWRRVLLFAGMVSVLVFAVLLGRPAFARWQERRLIAAAQNAIVIGDLRSAVLSARQALLKNPASTPACEILAQIAEREHSPEAILCRQRLVEINPLDHARLIELAVTATNLGEPFIAEQALDQIPASDRANAAFHTAAGGVAAAQKQWHRAEQEFQRAAGFAPHDENLRLNLATLRLALAPPGAAAEAVATLESFRQKPAFRHAALRALLTDARRRGDPATAREILEELRQGDDATLGDRLLLLEELQFAHSDEFDAALGALQSLAAKNAGAIYSVLTWMNAHALAVKSIAWCESLPAKTRAQMPVPLAEAEARTALADWKNLSALVREADWGDLDFLRLAIHARVLFEMDGQRRRTDFHARWESAQRATRGNPEALVMLGRLVQGWGWPQEAAEVWWLAARSGLGSRAALKALFQKYDTEKNTRELYRVARRILELEPQNPIAKNNVASLALLLGEDEAEAHRLAAENFRLAPQQPVIASTYAMSLHRQKRTREAAEIMERLPSGTLQDPALAACRGFLLTENDELEKARPFLEAADRQKEKLLPEEAAMVASAQRRRP